MAYVPIIPEGQHLGTSHQVDGAVTGHLFDDETNDLRGHAAWRWVDDPDEDDEVAVVNPPIENSDFANIDPKPREPRELTDAERELAAFLAALIVETTTRAVKAASPHVKNWWVRKVVPTAKSTWRHTTQSHPLKKKKKKGAVYGRTSNKPVRSVIVTTDVDVAEPKVTMSSAEWTRRYQAMLAAGAFQEEQLRILTDARLDDGAIALDSIGVSEELTSAQFEDRIKLMLESNPYLLEQNTSSELIRLFGRQDQELRELPVPDW